MESRLQTELGIYVGVFALIFVLSFGLLGKVIAELKKGNQVDIFTSASVGCLTLSALCRSLVFLDFFYNYDSDPNETVSTPRLGLSQPFLKTLYPSLADHEDDHPEHCSTVFYNLVPLIFFAAAALFCVQRYILLLSIMQ